MVILLVFAALIGGTIGFAAGLPHGWLAALGAAQVGAALVALLVALLWMRR